MNTEKFIKLTANDNFTVVSIPEVPDKELDSSFNDFVHRELDCDLYEPVYLRSIRQHNIVMLVDEPGLFKNKRPNFFPWLFYSSLDLSAPIVGDVLFVSTHRVGDLQELDFCGLDQEQIDYLTKIFNEYLSIVNKK